MTYQTYNITLITIGDLLGDNTEKQAHSFLKNWGFQKQKL